MDFAENDVYSSLSGEQEPQRVKILQQQLPQQPITIIQPQPGPPHPVNQPVRDGHMKEGLVELMMIQNAQMHQVIMNNISMAALSSIWYNAPLQPSQQNLIAIGMEESGPDTVYHHHYEPWQYPLWPSLPPLFQPHPYYTMGPLQGNLQPAVQHIGGEGPSNPQRELVLRHG
ncbi:proline-rich protein 29-like isoform X2 [Narcine bancroftii]|uniref:proline-rich protein 29-like isoform X2 n=1 Tax=Narcine bancroftii TaxID=1343680 RepID=UPI00383154F1